MKGKTLKWCMNSVKSKYPEYNQDKLDEIEYGLEAIYLTFTKLIVIFSIAYILGVLKELIILLFFYNLLRTTVFGMHAKKSWHCYLISISVFVGGALLCKYVDINIYVKYIISIIAFITLVRYAPADTYKRPLVNKYKRKRYKILTIILSSLYLIFIILLKDSVVSSYLCFGLLDASLMIHPLVYRMFQLPYDNYKNYNVTYS